MIGSNGINVTCITVFG